MKPEPCADCGSTTYVASMVVDGVRTCASCYIGLTALLRLGVPIAATPGELAPKKGGAR